MNSQRICAYLAPAQGVFQRSRQYLIDETISPQAFPEFKFAVQELLA